MKEEPDAAKDVEATERRRLRALVAGDIGEAERLHAEDFQLINPYGVPLSKSEYLGGIASGNIRYFRWEPEEIAVKVIGNAALVRYRSHVEIAVGGERSPPQRLWHTDAYRRQNGLWQVVWSHATIIQ